MTDGSPFDAAAATYDGTFSDTALGRRLRGTAWRWMDRAFRPGDRVLELGCGTGVDAVHLASRGVAVHATDASAAMLDHLRAALVAHDASDLVTAGRLDAETIGDPGWADELVGPFDGVLADFGALNTVADHRRLLSGLARVVLPGGHAVMAVMGPFCPWEIAWHLAHGERGAAVRRWRSGVSARVPGGGSVRVWYPSVRRLAQDAAPWWRVTRIGGIGVVLPPSGLSPAMERRTRLLSLLVPVEERMTETRLGAWAADHWIAELQRVPDA